MNRLSQLAPEEIAAVVLLAIVLTFAAFRPGAILDAFGGPYATPAPEGGPARELVPDAMP